MEHAPASPVHCRFHLTETAMRLRLLPLLCLAPLAHATLIVTTVEGEVRQGNAPVTVLRALDGAEAVQLAAGATLRIADTARARSGLWTGPATLQLAASGPRRSDGADARERTALPAGLRQALERAPANLATVATLGDDLPSRVISPKLKRAQQQYQQWRKQFARDDITPELYLLDVQLAARDGLGLQATLAEMARRQPRNAELARLSAHLVALNLPMAPQRGAEVEVAPYSER